MPAPKNSQAQKDLTRRRRDVRKHRKSCRKALGALGMRLFREFLNLHGRLPIETTARWAEALAQALGPDGTALPGMAPEKVSVPVLHDYRGQFAGWSQALLHRHHDSLTTTGLTFRVRILEVKGSAPNSWRGLLLVIYEHRYGVVFHDLKDIDANKPLRGEFIWKAIRQAVRRLSTGRWPYFKLDAKPPPKVTIALPVGYGGKPVHPLLDEALACQGDRELTSWRVETYPGLKPTVLKINDLSFSQLDRMLRHHSRKVSSVLRSLSPGKRRRSEEKESGARGPDRPAWLLLFPDEYPYDFRRKS